MSIGTKTPVGADTRGNVKFFSFIDRF